MRSSGSGVVLANQTKESEVRELSGKESGTGSETPFACKCYTKPLKKRVPELIPDSFPESSRTSLSSVWFAGTTPEWWLGVSDIFSALLSLKYKGVNLPPPRVYA